MCTELFYAIIPTLFLCFLLIYAISTSCYIFNFLGSRHRIDLQCTGYSSENIFIALGRRSEMIMGFHAWIYLTGPWIHNYRAMNTKHAQCTCYAHQLVTKPYTYGFSCSRLHVRLHSAVLSTLVIKLLRQCLQTNRTWTLHAWRPCEVKWLFSRTICTMTLLRDVVWPCSHWTNLPSRKLLEVTSQIVWHIPCMLKHLKLHASYADIGGLNWY